MTLSDLLQQDGIALKKVAHGEYSTSCPACGGTDRFRVWPEKGRWWCRGCEKSGDAIEYLRAFKGLSYFEACLASGT
ncbi:MAG: P4 alpha zinc-binding domain protein, partial [Desulfatibacillum sp.]|nr:P4 alpha zinc-binding domain protein [Desulfatibacillum sp.]